MLYSYYILLGYDFVYRAVCGHEDQRRASDPLDDQLQVVENSPGCAGNWTTVLWQSSNSFCSWVPTNWAFKKSSLSFKSQINIHVWFLPSFGPWSFVLFRSVHTVFPNEIPLGCAYGQHLTWIPVSIMSDKNKQELQQGRYHLDCLRLLFCHSHLKF